MFFTGFSEHFVSLYWIEPGFDPEYYHNTHYTPAPA